MTDEPVERPTAIGPPPDQPKGTKHGVVCPDCGDWVPLTPKIMLHLCKQPDPPAA